MGSDPGAGITNCALNTTTRLRLSEGRQHDGQAVRSGAARPQRPVGVQDPSTTTGRPSHQQSAPQHTNRLPLLPTPRLWQSHCPNGPQTPVTRPWRSGTSRDRYSGFPPPPPLPKTYGRSVSTATRRSLRIGRRTPPSWPNLSGKAQRYRVAAGAVAEKDVDVSAGLTAADGDDRHPSEQPDPVDRSGPHEEQGPLDRQRHLAGWPHAGTTKHRMGPRSLS